MIVYTVLKRMPYWPEGAGTIVEIHKNSYDAAEHVNDCDGADGFEFWYEEHDVDAAS